MYSEFVPRSGGFSLFLCWVFVYVFINAMSVITSDFGLVVLGIGFLEMAREFCSLYALAINFLAS